MVLQGTAWVVARLRRDNSWAFAFLAEEAGRESLSVRVIERDVFASRDDLRRDYGLVVLSEVVSDFRTTAELRRMFELAATCLAPGGRLVFVTCSLLPDEGEAQLTAALARHPGLAVERPTLPGLSPDWITPDGGLRLRPDYWADKGGMDGFFMACLKTP